MCTDFEEFECEVHTENTQLQSVADDFAIIDVIDIVQDDDIDDIDHNVQRQEPNVHHTVSTDFEEFECEVHTRVHKTLGSWDPGSRGRLKK